MHSMRRPPVCGQSVRRHIRTPSEGIWVSDAALARAFERYCAASPAARRHVSFAPGPLEGRRRLGRRHMTELYTFQAHASLPPWAFDMPADLENWNWYPPTLRNKPANSSATGQAEDNSLRNLLGLLSARAETSAPAEAEADVFRPAEDDIERDMQWLMEQTRSKDSADIQPSVDIFIDSLKAHARNGILTPSHIYEISITLPAILAASHGNTGPPPGLASLLDAVREITGFMKAARQSEFDPSFSNLFLNQLPLLKGHPAACEIFADFMSLIPHQQIQHVLDAVGVVLESVSINLPYAGYASASSTMAEAADAPTEPYEHPALWPRTITEFPFQRYAIPIARGLDRFVSENPEVNLKRLINTAMSVGRRRNQKKRHLFWLSVLARMRLVRQKLLLRVMMERFNKRCGGKGLSGAQASQLLALHWTSQGYLERPGYLLRDSTPGAQGDVLAQLACAVCEKMPSRRHAAYLGSICMCLARTGQLNLLVDSLEALCRKSSELDARPFAIVAVFCNHYDSAMRLLRLVEAHAKKFGEGARVFARAFDWRLWTDKTRALSMDHSVDAREMRRLLGVNLPWQLRRNADPFRKKASMMRGLPARTVSRLEVSAWNIVKHLATDAPSGRQLSRTALYLVTTRIRYLRAHDVKLTDPLLKALTKLLILDLVKGQPGRTSRLKWLMGLIAENQGHEAADAVGRELTMWRKRNLLLAQKKEEAAAAKSRLHGGPRDSEWDAMLAHVRTVKRDMREAAIRPAEPRDSERHAVSGGNPEKGDASGLAVWLADELRDPEWHALFAQECSGKGDAGEEAIRLHDERQDAEWDELFAQAKKY